ncbi:MAG: BrxE family protein [Chloroflexi bacterium]|nr:BrxE family protein [Chloroflexota bacterium]
MMTNKIDITKNLELRAIVLALGESTHFGWWKSQFLSPTGLSFLERLYPHTRFAGAVRSALLGAQEVHDANIGKGQVFHLFRLSPNTEWELDQALTEQSEALEEKYRTMLGNRARLINALAVSSQGFSSVPAAGPLLLDIPMEQMIPAIASAYLGAFQQGKQVFPYFEELH